MRLGTPAVEKLLVEAPADLAESRIDTLAAEFDLSRFSPAASPDPRASTSPTCWR